MRFAIVDDLPDHRALLEHAIERYCSANAIEAVYEQFASPESLMQAYAVNRFDVLFIDGYFDGSRGGEHETPGSDSAKAGSGTRGIDLALWLRAHGYAGPIIFSTYSTDFAVAGYEVDVAAYLVKPYGQAEMDAALDKVIRPADRPPIANAQRIVELPIGARLAASLRGDAAMRQAAYGTLYTIAEDDDGNPVLRVNTDRLIYCRSARHIVECYDVRQPDRPAFAVRMGLVAMETELLRLPQFFSPARGYIVNMDYVTGMEGEAFLLAGSAIRIPVSRRRAAEAKARYADHTFNAMRNGRPSW